MKTIGILEDDDVIRATDLVKDLYIASWGYYGDTHPDDENVVYWRPASEALPGWIGRPMQHLKDFGITYVIVIRMEAPNEKIILKPKKQPRVQEPPRHHRKWPPWRRY
jgi:hypothetical protein